MGYLVFFGLIVLLLSCWGSGTFFAAVALMIALLFVGVGKLPAPATAAIVLVVFAGPIAAMLTAPFLSPLFSGEVPASLRTLLVAAGYLFMLESSQTWSLLRALSGDPGAISISGILTLSGDILVAAMLIAALALAFVALIELPFAWFFRERRAQSISWLRGVRPLLLVFFLGLSLSQVGGYFTDLLEQSPKRLVSQEIVP